MATTTTTLQPATVALIAEWKQLQGQLKEIQDAEREKRQAIVASLFDANKTEGTETLELESGWKLKAVKKLNYDVHNGTDMDALELICAACNMQTVFDDMFNFKPELRVSVYKNSITLVRSMLTPDIQIAFDNAVAAVVTIKPGMPELKLIDPKG